MANTILSIVDENNDSFFSWITKTNDAIQVLTSQAVTVTNTVNGDTVNGNGFVTGILGANTITATTLRGGTVNSSANLSITTNTTFSGGYVNVVANTLIWSNSTIAAAVFGGNSTVTNTTFNSTLFNINSNVAVVGASHTISGNANFDSGVLFVDSINNRVGVNVTTPNNSLTVNGNLLVTGSMVYSATAVSSNTVTTTGTSQAVIDSFAAATYRSGKYVISISDDVAQYQASEIMVMHDGVTSYLTEYAVLRSNSSLGTFASDISAGNVRLLFTPTVANSSIKLTKTLLGV